MKVATISLIILNLRLREVYSSAMCMKSKETEIIFQYQVKINNQQQSHLDEPIWHQLLLVATKIQNYLLNSFPWHKKKLESFSEKTQLLKSTYLRHTKSYITTITLASRPFYRCIRATPLRACTPGGRLAGCGARRRWRWRWRWQRCRYTICTRHTGGASDYDPCRDHAGTGRRSREGGRGRLAGRFGETGGGRWWW